MFSDFFGALWASVTSQDFRTGRLIKAPALKDLTPRLSTRNKTPLELNHSPRLKPAPYPPSRAALWFPMAACWTRPPPPPGRCAWAADTRPAPRADTPDGCLLAPAGWGQSALRNVTAASGGSCSPGSEYAASCTWTALGAKSQSGEKKKKKESEDSRPSKVKRPPACNFQMKSCYEIIKHEFPFDGCRKYIPTIHTDVITQLIEIHSAWGIREESINWRQKQAL